MDPAVAGFLMLVNSMVMLVPAFSELPPDRVMVITFPETVTVSVPSKLVPASSMAVAPPLLMVKPAGRVMTIFPSAGSPLAKVNVTSTLPTAPATKLSGCTLIPVRSPITVFTAVWESPKVAVEERGNIGTTAELMLAVAARGKLGATAELMLAVAARGNFGKNEALMLAVAARGKFGATAELILVVAARGKLGATAELMLAVAARGNFGKNVSLILAIAPAVRGKLTITPELMVAVPARGKLGGNVELMFAVALRGKLGANVDLIIPVAAMLRG